MSANLRGLLRSPGFTCVAVLSLALGIGANTAIFSLVNAVLLRSLPVADPSKLVLVQLKSPDFGNGGMSHYMYQAIRDRNTSLSGFAAISPTPPISLSDGDRIENVQGELVTGNFFDVLGVHAILGRVFNAQDDVVPDGHPVCVISYNLWQRVYGGDPAVIGRSVHLNRRAFTIAGVTPKLFQGIRGGADVDVRMPVMMVSAFSPAHPLNSPNFTYFMRAFGRLRDGVSMVQAEAAIESVYEQANRERPSNLRLAHPLRVKLESGAQGFAPLRIQYERPLLLLLSVVALVLLIACANVANLMMTRAAGRRREIGIRLALGASRARLVRGLLAESVAISMCGAAVGIAVAIWAARILAAMAPKGSWGFAQAIDVHPDWRVFAFTAAAGLATGILCGIVPAFASTRERIEFAPSRFPFAKTMAVAQIGVSLILLIAAGLFLRSLRNLRNVAPGFDPQHLVMMSINPPAAGYKAAESWRVIDEILDRAKTTPGVLAAAWARMSPLEGSGAVTNFDVAGTHGEAWLNGVSPDYFRTLDTPLIAGRSFAEQDEHATIINQTAAARYFPNGGAIGRHVNIGGGDEEIVGIVRDMKYESLRQDIPATAYVPLKENEPLSVTLHVRSTRDVAPEIVRAIHAIDPNLPVYNVTTMDAQIDNSLATDRLLAMLTSAFGALGVFLAALGLYGVVAYGVAARTREIGVRMALGADRRRVVAMVLAESAVIAMFGLGIGLAGAAVGSRAIGALLYGVHATDISTYVLAGIGLGMIALAAALGPAMRAARIDPMVALRHE